MCWTNKYTLGDHNPLLLNKVVDKEEVEDTRPMIRSTTP